MNLPLIDVAISAFFIISILIGLYRGFIKEALSVVAWVLAAVVAFTFGELVSAYIKPFIKQEPLNLAVAYVVVFLIAIIILSIIAHVVSQLFASFGMKGIDRTLGGVFGVLRAALVVAMLILVGRFMAMDNQQWWTDSGILEYFEPTAEWLKSYLPADVIKKIQA